MRTTLSTTAVLAALFVLAVATTGLAQQGTSAQNRSPEELWDDFIHYIRIARPELARSFGEALLDSDAEPRDIYTFSEETPDARRTLTRGERLEDLEEVIAQVREQIELGYRDMRADPQEIERAIELLGGTLRGYEMGAERLRRSGEFALPQLIDKLRDPEESDMLKERIVTVLPTLGRDAVRGLSVALQSEEASIVEIMAETLAEIGYGHAAPRLREAYKRDDLPERTQKAVRVALVATGGEAAVQKQPAELFYRYAEQYYYKAESLRPDEQFDEANLWRWSEDTGLSFMPAPIEIFYDVYAMRFCRLALSHDEEFSPAVELWVASNLRREANLPPGAEDPTRGEDEPSAEYYALAAGAGYLQRVLARGLGDEEIAVVTGAIKALAETTGAKTLVKPVEGGAKPLVEAMSYPDSRVRFLAALSLAEALPEDEFTGYAMVLWTLNESLRQPGPSRAMLVAEEQQMRNRLKADLREAGFEVLDAEGVSEAKSMARDAGVDVVVLADRPNPVDATRAIRREIIFSAIPIIIAEETARTAELADEDGRIVTVEKEVEQDELAEAVEEGLELAEGRPMEPRDVEQWAMRAAAAIEKLGMTENPLFDVTLTRDALADAIEHGGDELKVACAQALAAMHDQAAQRLVADLALNDDADESVRIRAFKQLSASLRRFGNYLENGQRTAVVDVVRSRESFELREAAAQALGAMDLPAEYIKDLILDTGAAFAS